MSKIIFKDKVGNVVTEGDQIMYITDGPSVNYGVVSTIGRSETCFGYNHWKIKVWKTAGPWHSKDRYVTLTEPTVFRCGVELRYPK